MTASLISISTIALSVVGFFIVWGKIKQQVYTQGEQIERLFHSIYKSNGTLVYVTEDLCKEKTKDMQHDLKEIKEDIREIRENFQTFQKHYEERSRELSFNIGSLLAKANKGN